MIEITDLNRQNSNSSSSHSDRNQTVDGKCNVDAGYHNGVGKTSAGWCIQEHTGQFVRTGTSGSKGNVPQLKVNQ
jgi:hypothetical protein